MRTERTRRLPPLFTQVIGSLPRPQAVRDLVAARDRRTGDGAGDQAGPADAEALDSMVAFAIGVQEQAGLDVVSDGEWRRGHYIGEFLSRVGGFEKVRPYEHQGERKLTDVVVRRMQAGEPVFARDAAFLASHTRRVTKFALPSPFLIAVRYWHQDFSREAYPTLEHFLAHLAELLAREAQAVAAAGIDIVQLDDPALAYFCDRRLTAGESIHDERLRREWNIDRQFPQALAAIGRVVDGLAAEVHLHCCHSVYKRQSDVRGDYRPILSRFAGAPIDRLNLEFAYEGTGDVSDLDLLPEGIDLGMGVVDVRTEQPQSIEAIERLAAAGIARIGAARMALNPDCGFAPGAGEPPTLDEAYEKLKRLVAAAKRLRERFAGY